MHSQEAEAGDDTLVAETLGGSREAYGFLVVRHARAVRAACLARLGLRADTDDMVQETFLRAFKGLHRLADRSRFGAYVHRIAHNICIDRLRRSRDTLSLDEVDLEPSRDEDAPADEKEERLGRLRRHVGTLPPALREAVLLFYFERMSHAQIARTLGITEAAVNQRLHRARTSLRQAFGVRVRKSP